MAARYRLFYAYVGTVLIVELARLCCYHWSIENYPLFYWATELVTIVAGYAVLVEIFKQILRDNPGINRFAQASLQLALAATIAYVLLLRGGSSSLARFIADFGRDLRYVEAAFVAVMLWLLVRYRILVARNLLGIIIGYSFWLAVYVAILVLFYRPGSESPLALRRLSPLTYVATLMIWCFTLWSGDTQPLAPARKVN